QRCPRRRPPGGTTQPGGRIRGSHRLGAAYMTAVSPGRAGGGAGAGAGVLDLRPAPGAAPRRRMLAAQAGVELRLTLRHGESVLLTLIIPIGLLAFFSTV